MQACRPRYVLIAEAETIDTGRGWRFALLAADGSASIAASDMEEGADEERLVLLAAVRGLEALDQPSAVTLVTRSASVQRGVTRGLEAWRNNHWRWERFGRLTPVRDADLWRRVDQAMRFHQVRCQTWRLDGVELASPTIGPEADVEPLEELAVGAIDAAALRVESLRLARDGDRPHASGSPPRAACSDHGRRRLTAPHTHRRRCWRRSNPPPDPR